MPNATQKAAKRAPKKSADKAAPAPVEQSTEQPKQQPRRRPSIKANAPGGQAAKSAQVTAKVTGGKPGNAGPTKSSDAPAQSSGAAKRNGKATGKASTAKAAAPKPEPVPARKPTPNKDGKIDDTSFEGFVKYRPIIKETDRNRNRVGVRFERPMASGTEVNSALFENGTAVLAATAKVKGMQVIDENTAVLWFLGVDPKNESCYWLVGTIGDDQDTGKLVVVREYASGRVTAPSRMEPSKATEMFKLGFAWDADDIRRWQIEPESLAS